MYSDVWQSIEAADAMVLDDPGTEFLDRAGSMGVRMDGLLDARYREIRKTLITTNLCVEDFSARYGERVMDRIRDGGCFYEFTAESMRR